MSLVGSFGCMVTEYILITLALGLTLLQDELILTSKVDHCSERFSI